jgi:hypothetical protein
MRILPVRRCALRMAILLCSVVAIDGAAALLTAKPQFWCAIIPALIPILTPAAIFSYRVESKN